MGTVLSDRFFSRKTSIYGHLCPIDLSLRTVPLIGYVLKMANIFGVSTDLVLDRDTKVSIETDGLDEYDVKAIHSLIVYLRKKNGKLVD